MTRTNGPQTDLPYTAFSFLIGAGTSVLAGYIGMRIAVYTNSRTTFSCCKGDIQDGVKDLSEGFFVAFKGGQVLGFVLVGLALLVLQIIIWSFRTLWFDATLKAEFAKIKKGSKSTVYTKAAAELVRRLFELVAGYGLGGSTVALFGRVGGGIYTKAADVGADLVGKTIHDLKEDDVNNPGTIADNVGDNVGDIAGMGSDLFGSLAESTCAALVVSATSVELIEHTDALYFPLCITASGALASFVSVLCAHVKSVTVKKRSRLPQGPNRPLNRPHDRCRRPSCPPSPKHLHLHRRRRSCPTCRQQMDCLRMHLVRALVRHGHRFHH